MSSFDFRGLRVQGNDPQTQFIIELQKTLVKFLLNNQTEALESETEDIYSDAQDMETAIKWHSELSSQQQFTYLANYYPCFEPDGDKVTLYLKGRNVGGVLTDYSGFNNTVILDGDPTMVAGPAGFDPGIHTHGTKATAIRFNRPTSPFQNEERIRIADATRISIAGQTTGHSIFVRFIAHSLADQNGRSPTIYAKIDDSTSPNPNDGTMLELKSDGRLVLIIRDGGSTVVAKETAAGTIVVDQLYDVFVTYAVSGGVPHIYVNGTDKTLANFTGNINWQNELTDHQMWIFYRGAEESEGHVWGDFFTFKYYREMIVSQAQVTNHWNNKVTISPHAFGTTMHANYFATLLPGAGGVGASFTTTSFTSTSFTE